MAKCPKGNIKGITDVKCSDVPYDREKAQHQMNLAIQHAKVVVITGEAGVGKTTLAHKISIADNTQYIGLMEILYDKYHINFGTKYIIVDEVQDRHAGLLYGFINYIKNLPIKTIILTQSPTFVLEGALYISIGPS